VVLHLVPTFGEDIEILFLYPFPGQHGRRIFLCQHH
jgi:hypothetical protein